MAITHVTIPCSYDKKSVVIKENGGTIQLQIIGPTETSNGENKQLLVVGFDATGATLLAQSLSTVIKGMNKR